MSWFTGNPDARLARIEYVGAGNRPPLAEISLDKTQAGIPAQITASAKQSTDLDGDKITYAWKKHCAEAGCLEQQLGDGVELSLPFDKAGKYTLELTVTDAHGAKTTTAAQLDIGNEPPVIEFASTQNQSFYWSDTAAVDFSFSISDKEDGVINAITDANPLIQFS